MKAKIDGNSISYLRNICSGKLADYYPAGIPDAAWGRLEKELGYVEKTDSMDAWRIYYEFNEVAKKNQSLITIRGTSNNTLLAFLLGNTPFDPLSAYYYCPKCGHYETIGECTFGIDADEKKCPDCGEKLEKRGYNLNEVFAWGESEPFKDCGFMYDYPHSLKEFLRTTLKRLYSQNEIVEYLDRTYIDGKISISMGGYAILPAGKDAITDYPHLVSYNENGVVVFEGGYIDYADGDIMLISAFENETINTIMKMQEKTGIYYYEMEIDKRNSCVPRALVNTNLISDEEEIALSFKDKANVFQMAELFAIAHNTYSLFEEDEPDANDQIYASVLREDMFELPADERFFTRETLYERLLSLGLNEHDAFVCTEFVRKGKVKDTKRWRDMAEQYKVPNDICEFCEGYRYMWTRAYGLLNYFLLSICAEYQKINPVLYMKTISEP